jgi:hypothetical protein
MGLDFGRGLLGLLSWFLTWLAFALENFMAGVKSRRIRTVSKGLSDCSGPVFTEVLLKGTGPGTVLTNV